VTPGSFTVFVLLLGPLYYIIIRFYFVAVCMWEGGGGLLMNCIGVAFLNLL
jgi:hypothetical protein